MFALLISYVYILFVKKRTFIKKNLTSLLSVFYQEAQIICLCLLAISSRFLWSSLFSLLFCQLQHFPECTAFLHNVLLKLMDIQHGFEFG